MTYWSVNSNERYCAVLSNGTVTMPCRSGLTFEFGWNPKMWPFQWKPLNSTVYYPEQGVLNFLVFEKKKWYPPYMPQFIAV